MPDTVSLDLARTALFVCDMQNGFIKPRGSIGKLGLPSDRTPAVIPPIQELVATFRAAGAPIIYSQMWLRPDYRDAGILAEVFPPLQALGHCVADTWDAAIIDELAPEPSDIVVRKTRWDAFQGTNLEMILRNLGVDTIVMTGIATNVCVEYTVHGAFVRDFRVHLVTDATASYTEEMEQRSLAAMAFGCARMTTTADVLEAVESGVAVA